MYTEALVQCFWLPNCGNTTTLESVFAKLVDVFLRDKLVEHHKI